MTDSEKMDFAASVFSALSGENQSRLLRAEMDRRRMHDSIKRGESPRGARPDWIKDCAVKLVPILSDMAKAFDAANPTDKATNGDLMDVLSTAAALFRRG